MHDKSAPEVVRALFLAHSEGRIDDVLALVHPNVVWQPLTRPARSEYLGHAGTRAMIDDLRAALGDFRVDFDAFTELPGGKVLARGEIVRSTPEGEIFGPSVGCVVTLSEGLIIALDSSEPSDTASDHRQP
jgi:ketosteroid isomerase-like protein